MSTTDGTTRAQLNAVLSMHPCTRPYLGGVMAANEIPVRLGQRSTFFIVNSDENWKTGAHWLLLVFAEPPSPAVYFDPLGKPPSHYSKYIDNYLKIKSRPYYIANNVKYQPSSSNNCGQFCAFVADRMCQGESFADTLRHFDPSNLKSNDVTVMNYYKRHMQKTTASGSAPGAGKTRKKRQRRPRRVR